MSQQQFMLTCVMMKDLVTLGAQDGAQMDTDMLHEKLKVVTTLLKLETMIAALQ